MQSRINPNLVIEDTQPSLVRNWADLLYALSAIAVAILTVLSTMWLSATTVGVEIDARSASKIIGLTVTGIPCALIQQGLTLIVVAEVIAFMAARKRWIDTAISVITLFVSYGSIWLLSDAIASTHNLPLLSALHSQPTNSVTELLPDMYAVLVAFLTVSGPRKEYKHVMWGWNALFIVSAILLFSSWDSYPAALISCCVGRAIGTLIRFAKGTSSKGAWGDDIVIALKNIGIDNLTQLTRRTQQADHTGVLRSSLDDDLIENSRLYDATDIHGMHYVISVLDNQVHLPGYLNQLWQWVRLIDIPTRRDRSARHSVHHHLSMLLVLRNLHLPTANVYGVSDSDKSSIMVFHAANALLPCNLNTLTVEDAAKLMRYVDAANMRGITHRRITPETIARLEDGTPVIAGWQNGDVASDSTNIALDKVQLLTLIAACTDIDTSIKAALNAWGADKLAEILPFMQKAAIPASTRSLPSWNKKVFEHLCNKLSQTVALHTDEEDYDTVRLARFNIRFFVSLVLAIIAIAVIATQWHPQEVFAALKHANNLMVLLCFIFSMLAWVGSAITLGSFMDDQKPSSTVLFASQAASGFTAVSMPAGVGPAFVNMQLLKKNGYNSTQATAITSAVWLIQALITTIVLLVIGIFTGKNVLSGMIPTHMLITVIGIITLLICTLMAIPKARKIIRKHYLPILSDYGRQIKELVSHPLQLIGGSFGAIVLVSCIGLGYWVALLAFGYYANPWETILLFILANTAGSAIPTPGGLGAVEASLTFAFTSVGVPPTIALSATLLYRLMFYWLRIPIGAFAMNWLSSRELV
ncbi:lysylphosphatidylglycerol synthase transmembrane domain-containing protein [Gardnerella greenwoodii]|uniref:TIGR00374 family protein n=1 Tax=Gardnerella greenwoodii TaxID=2914925 RepID=A0A2N6RY10_9BIFI|nr:lysylphosphatidylglycerol synthase transmembrane domain-containing protein [Gardnerella greenwoodii]MDF0753210.1 flippase-like domain-containing protein [Gardnerella greenwoodii]PMC42952.1 TIGR00374 family protein [Gardnerella greenwoodii]